MANPRKFSEKIALHNQKQAEETAAFEKIMQEVSAATNKPEETCLAAQYGQMGGRSGGTSPSRAPGPRGRTASSSVGPGPMRNRPAERKHDTSPYGSSVYLSPPPQDSSWRRTNSDSALHQTCELQPGAALSPHHPLHSHAHPHTPQHQTHRRADIHLEALTSMGANSNNRPRSSCEIPRIPNNTNVYEGGGGGGGGLTCGELQMPGGSLPDLTSVHYPPPHPAYSRPSPQYHHHQQSPSSPGGVSPPGGSVSPATGGLSPASGSPVGATVPPHDPHGMRHDNGTGLYEQKPSFYLFQSHLSVPNSNNYLHQNKNMSPLEHSWMSSSYQPPCSPPSQYSSTSNINIPSPTMAHSPGSPVESPQTDYSLQSALLQPFESFTMQGILDNPTTNYNQPYMNHAAPHSPQPSSSPHTYPQSPHRSSPLPAGSRDACRERTRDPVPGGHPAFPPLPVYSAPDTPIPDIILTDYSSEQLRAGLDLDDLSLLDEPSALLPDSSVEHEFRLDRL
ncbi:CREB-regulated transcription coactivator 3 isoform X3 [Plutella xylostella]|uniref:CREB-regulated transcription coactivator 3 isoform X3 n=1 Tax=Plutella xylostella TaxID=51655 RepID=UPI0020324376|nr:CREB-regulated transcription coactivator 3 isoform X3 [Plutella xylostella]